MTVPHKQSAVAKLERSKLNPASVQRELLGDDLDLQGLLIYLKSKIQYDAIERVKDVQVGRTIEGASTVVVTIIDPDRAVLRSGKLASKLDIQLDGLWFRLVKVEKTGDLINLTFEDREIAILRTYKKLKVAHRGQVTRAEFVNNLIKEVKEFTIPVVIPQLHKVEPIQKAKDLPYSTDTLVQKSAGIPDSIVNTSQEAHRHGETNADTSLRRVLTVKHIPIEKQQVANANIICQVGQSMGARRKVIVCAIMTAIQESTLRNLPYGDRDSLGLFQQRASQGWGNAAQELDPATASRMFFNRAIGVDKDDPTRPYWDICQAVQHSAFPDAYAQWQTEADNIVSSYGIVGNDNEGTAAAANTSAAVAITGSDYIFYRGIPMQGGKTWKKEDSWTCISRLASEVGWRAFFISGVFYFINEDDLFKSKPLATIGEDSDGVELLDGDYDTGKKSATVTLEVRVGTWLLPPGAVIVLEKMGPWDGRWIVTDFSRSLFDSKASLTLRKPMPQLPEPLQNDINQTPTWAQTPATTADPSLVGPDFGGVLPDDIKGTRQGVVTIALRALAAEKIKHYHYLRSRPMPSNLWSAQAHAGIDCSSFATLVYKEASCTDPNNANYDGQGNTSTLIAHGLPVTLPLPGDLVFYLGDGSRMYPGHVAVYVGNNEVVEIGSDNGVLKLPYNYRTDIVGYRRYLDA